MFQFASFALKFVRAGSPHLSASIIFLSLCTHNLLVIICAESPCYYACIITLSFCWTVENRNQVIGLFVVEENSRIGQFLYWRILWSISNAIIDQSPWMKHALLPREAQSFYQIPGKAISQSKLSLFDKYHWLFRANAKSKFWKIHLKIWMKLALLPREHQGLYQIPGKAIPQSKLTLFDKYHWLLKANTMSTF